MEVPGQYRLTQKVAFHAGRRAMDWLKGVPKEERDVLVALLSIQPYLGFIEIEHGVINNHIPVSPFWTPQMQQAVRDEVLGALGRMLMLGFQSGWYSAKLSERGAPPMPEEVEEQFDELNPVPERKM